MPGVGGIVAPCPIRSDRLWSLTSRFTTRSGGGGPCWSRRAPFRAGTLSRSWVPGRQAREGVNGVIIAGFVMLLAVAPLALFGDPRLAAGLACCLAALALWRAA